MTHNTTMAPAEAVALIPDDAVIVAGPGCGTPTTLLRAIGERARPDYGWQLWSALLLGPLGFVDAVREGRLAYRTWHVVPQVRDLVATGQADLLPVRAADVPSMLERSGVAAAVVRVSPPDARGYCSLGTSVSYTRAAVHAAQIVIAEVDDDMPRTEGMSLVHVSDLTALVGSEDPTPEYPARPVSEEAVRIAAHVLRLLPPNPVLQVGLGEIPEAMTSLLGNLDLGSVRFVGLGTDNVVTLFDEGVLSPSDVVPTPAVMAVELMGTRRLLDYADRNPVIGVYPVDVAGDPRSLGTVDNFVSITSALQVDLDGQVNTEFVGGRQVAGMGGGVDFTEAARASPGGVRIVALRSTAGGRSRIVPRLEAYAPVTIPRHSVDHVVTEYGVASLAGLSPRRRAAALTAVAAPEHRDWLTAATDAPGRRLHGRSVGRRDPMMSKEF